MFCLINRIIFSIYHSLNNYKVRRDIISENRLRTKNGHLVNYYDIYSRRLFLFLINLLKTKGNFCSRRKFTSLQWNINMESANYIISFNLQFPPLLAPPYQEIASNSFNCSYKTHYLFLIIYFHIFSLYMLLFLYPLENYVKHQWKYILHPSHKTILVPTIEARSK